MITDKNGVILALGQFAAVANGYLCNGVVYPVSICDALETVAPAEVTPGAWSYANGVFAKVPQPVSDEQRSQAIRNIDVDVDAIYVVVMGNRASEYALTEADALAFMAAGYAGPVPASILAWGVPKKQSAQWATDDILATARNWRMAQGAIRASRLARKEDIRNAVTQDDVALVVGQWDGFVLGVKQQLGI